MNTQPAGAGISVIIPVLNEADNLPGLLQDLHAQRGGIHERILVDGGSSDATLQLAGPWVDRVIHSPPGRATQMNAGARAASGELLWFVHADSGLAAGSVERLQAALQAGAAWGRFDVRLSGRDWRLRVIERMMNLRSRLSGIATGDQGIFVRRELFERIGAFPEIPLMEDIALSRSLRSQTRPICLRQPKLLTSSRRWETRGITATVLLMWRLRLAYALGAAPQALARRYR